MEDKYSMQPGQEHEPNQPDAEDVDALLQDVKSLLGESDGEAAEQPRRNACSNGRTLYAEFRQAKRAEDQAIVRKGVGDGRDDGDIERQALRAPARRIRDP